MSRTLTMFAVSLAAGFAFAGPGHDHKHDDKAHAHDEAATPTLAEFYADRERPELWIGSKAPALKLAHFSRGEAITSFEPGRTYVIEMWATWCGPCIAAFPHVSELQEKYKDSMSVIGVNIWEREEGEARIELVDAFVEEHTEMKYTVAVEEGTEMAETWMKAAGRNGIPSAFIVDGEGKVAWMGHPNSMDEPLDQIIKGDYDTKAAAESVWNEQLSSMAFRDIHEAGAEGDHDRIGEIGNILIGSLSDDANGLSQTSLSLLGVWGAPESNIKLAHKAALKASELTEWEDWVALYAYAWASYAMGDNAEAVKWQEKVVELTDEHNKDFMTQRLELYRGEG